MIDTPQAANAIAASDSRAYVWPLGMRVVHWLTVAFLIVGVTAVLVTDLVEGRDARNLLMDTHRQAGLLILLLVIIRVGTRLRVDGPRWLQSTPVKFAATATHVAMYLLMFALPVLGWLLTDARGKPVTLLGIPLPTLIARDRDVAESIESWHSLAGWTLLVLVGLHALVALWHHFGAKDDVLRAMLGRARVAPSAAIPASAPAQVPTPILPTPDEVSE